MKLRSPNGFHRRFTMAILASFMMTGVFVSSANAYNTCPGNGFCMNTYTGCGISVGIDDTTLESLTYVGQDWRYIYDRRVGFTMNYAWLFDAVWEDGHATEFQLNSEFTFEEAQEHAAVFAPIVGRLPKFARHDVDSVTLHGGSEAGGGGGSNMLYHIDSTYPTIYNFNYSCEELMLHEAGHCDLSADHAYAPGWIAAQDADGAFISQYAQDFPFREDVTESMGGWFAVRHRPERVSQGYIDFVTDTIPNRLAYFDSLNLDPYPANKPIAEPFIDSTSSLVTFAPYVDWSVYEIPGSYLNYVHACSTAGATAAFAFTGTQATLYGMTRDDLGKADIYIDGIYTDTVDFYGSQTATFQPLYETPVLASGNHTLAIEVTGEYNPAATATAGEIIIDAVRYIADIPADTDPPTPIYSVPGPAAWASTPVAVSGTAIRMEATAGCDISHPIEYYFDETSGNPGGTDSGWQTGRFYTDTGLDLDTQYTYTVRMRDALQNVGSVSAAASATTAAIAGSNFFMASYTGSRTDFTGWVGYEFTPSEDITIEALGRSVSTSMLNNHDVKIWRVADQAEVAASTMTPSSATDALGYALEALSSAVTLSSGVTYRIASWETSGGDAFRDVGDLSSHKAVASIGGGVYGGGSYPVNSYGGVENGYVPATFYYSASESDTDPPSPNPAAFASAPVAVSGTEITMVSTTGIDTSGPVEYYFDEVTGNPGGTDSGWQISPIYTDSGLDRNTQYSYTVQMRDTLQNAGSVSAAASATTPPVTGRNFFTVPYAGSRSNFTGWVGYEFTPVADLTIDALGRYISRSMLNNHDVKIWRVSDQAEVAAVTVTPSSMTDGLGYAYEPLPAATTLSYGVTYRIASFETSGGDAFRDVANICRHTAVANINGGVYGSGSYPGTGSGTVETGYVPATFFYASHAVDADEDGMSDGDEAIAGTNPTDPASWFAITNGTGSGFVVEWTAVSNRQYQVYRTDGLTNSFNPIGPVLYFPQNSYTDAVPRSASFYKVEVQMQ